MCKEWDDLSIETFPERGGGGGGYQGDTICIDA